MEIRSIVAEQFFRWATYANKSGYRLNEIIRWKVVSNLDVYGSYR